MTNKLIPTAISLLGMPVRDLVTGFKGVVGSVTFDAYGCVQALVTPPAIDNKLGDTMWFDVKRLVVDGPRVMPEQDFGLNYGQERGGNTLPRMPTSPIPRS